MIDRLDVKKCTGCFACVQKCPKNCIGIKQDEEGFYYPYINEANCVHCDLCEQACPQLTPIHLNIHLAAYAARAKDAQQLKHSTSGGVFPVFAKYVLQNGGVVFGAAMDEIGRVKHIAVQDLENLHLLQGSKYVQSSTLGAYREAKRFLEEGRLVLFSGTPCQIAGLYGFLGKKYDCLLTMDLVCHGVPSEKLFLQCRHWLENKYGSNLHSWSFRDKEREGWALVDKLVFEDKVRYKRGFLNPYTRAFYLGEICRESCYPCTYACENRIGDITCGDYWGIKNHHPEFYSNQGVSLLVVNTEQGEKYLKLVHDGFYLLPSRMEYIKAGNGSLVRPSSRPEKRDRIYKSLNQLPLDEFMRKELNVPLDIKEYLKQWIPYATRQKIKKLLFMSKRAK